jgi:uncharacterized membrane protein YkoI
MPHWRVTVAAGLLIGFAVSASAMSAKEIAAAHQAKLTLRQAIVIAQREVPGSLLVDADVATVGGKMSYAIELLKDGLHDVRINMADGTILRIIQKRVHPKDWKTMAAVEHAAIKLLDAIGLAENEVAGARLISADVTTRRGKPIFDIRLQHDGRLRTVLIDPASGSVMKIARSDR